MRTYAFIFVSSFCIFQQACTSSSNWKEVIAIRHQIREIKSIIDNVLIPLKVASYKEGTLEFFNCYKEAESKLSSVQQIAYSEVTNCIRDSKRKVAVGIVCAVHVQQTVREVSQAVKAEANKCMSDLNIEDPTCTNKTSIGEIVFKDMNVVSQELI